MPNWKYIVIIFFSLVTFAHAQTTPPRGATLTWKANTETDLKGYRIYRDNLLCTQQGPKRFVAEVGKVTTWADAAIPPADFIVSYQITAIDLSLNESLKSNCVDKTFFVAPAMGVFRAGTSTETSIEVILDPVADGAGATAKYDVRYAVAPLLTNGGWPSANKMPSCTDPGVCVIQGLSAGTAYEVQVMTYRGIPGADAVNGPVSAALTISTLADTVAPQAPTELRISGLPGDGTALLRWEQPGGLPEKHRVDRLNQTTGDWIVLASVAGDMTEATAPLAPVGRRLFRVCAVQGKTSWCARNGVWAAR